MIRLKFGENGTVKCPFVNFNELNWFKDKKPLDYSNVSIKFSNISSTDEGNFERQSLVSIVYHAPF